MPSKQFDVRVKNKIDTTKKWNGSSLILMKGEHAYEETADGKLLEKVGDGINLWSALPYLYYIPTKVSELTNDAGYLTSDIIAGTVNQITEHMANTNIHIDKKYVDDAIASLPPPRGFKQLLYKAAGR